METNHTERVTVKHLNSGDILIVGPQDKRVTVECVERRSGHCIYVHLTNGNTFDVSANTKLVREVR